MRPEATGASHEDFSSTLCIRLFGRVGTNAQSATTTAIVIPDPAAGSNAPDVSGASYSAEFTFNDALGVLSIDLSNNSLASIGGFLTAFVFNIPVGLSYVAASYTQTNVNGSPDPFLLSLNVSAMPYGTYDILTSATGNTFNGGGMPKGLAIGESAIFSYTFAAGDLTEFSAASFLTGDNFFVGRFRGIDGLDNLDSDKLPGTVSAVPLPAALPLLGAGLAGLGAIGWVRRRRNPETSVA